MQVHCSCLLVFSFGVMTANLKHLSMVVSHVLPVLGPRLTELCPCGGYCSSGRKREEISNPKLPFKTTSVERKHIPLPTVY